MVEVAVLLKALEAYRDKVLHAGRLVPEPCADIEGRCEATLAQNSGRASVIHYNTILRYPNKGHACRGSHSEGGAKSDLAVRLMSSSV